MAFIRKKVIHGKKRRYLEQSFRLPDGSIKKVSVYIKEPSAMAAYRRKAEERIAAMRADFAVRHYAKNYVFTADTIRRLEEIRNNYRKITQKLTEKQWSDVLDRFTINFTYESNAIEGNSLTLKDVAFIIQEGKILKGKDLREVYETINTRRAIEWLMKKRPAVEERAILKLHEILVQNTGIATGYKKLPNFLLGRSVRTIPPELVKKEMKELIDSYKKDAALYPLQLAAQFHGKFEKIHPFEDGNGRVGRLLINLMLLSRGYPPLIIRKTQRVRYFHALEAFDHGHPDNLYYFLIDKYKQTYEQFFKVYIRYL